MIVIIDYNVGNIKSVCNAFRYIGCDVKLSCERDVIKDASGLVLPGVAAFGYAVDALGHTAEMIKEAALGGKPLLGICVGYQMLFDQSSEYGPHNGLGLVRGRVVPIPTGTRSTAILAVFSPRPSEGRPSRAGSPCYRKIPHMGWNLVKLPKDMNLFTGLGSEKHFYFAHSFYADIADSQARVAYADYGFDLPASVQKANIYGVQFHPEKSGKAGLKVLENFAAICRRSS